MVLGPPYMQRVFRGSLAVGAVVLVLVFGTACGGDDEDSPATGGNAQGESSAVETSGKSAGSPKVTDAPRADGPSLTGNVEQARAGVESVHQVYESFGTAVEEGVAGADVPVGETLAAAGRNAGLKNVCGLMSEQAKRQTIEYARRSAGLADVKWTCENSTGLLLRRARQAGALERSLRVEVVGVNVQGDRATASVRFGGKGAISSIPLVKENGVWKVGASPAG